MTETTPTLAPTTARVAALVVGLGAPDRGDDAVGLVVARDVEDLALPGVETLVHEDPTDLIELWSGRGVAVVVDALRSGEPPGTVQVLETGAGGEHVTESLLAHPGWGGTHALGLAAAVELARALKRLPERVVVVGVEAACFDHGAPLSPRVAGAVPQAVAAVVEALGAPRREVSCHVPR